MTKETFEPVYEGYYHVFKTRGNQVDVQSVSGECSHKGYQGDIASGPGNQ